MNEAVVSQPSDFHPLTESEFSELPHWPRVALLARMALRLTPFFEPPEGQQATGSLLAYVACAALAAKAARDEQSPPADLLAPAVKILDASRDSGLGKLALKIALGAASQEMPFVPLETLPGPLEESQHAVRGDFEALLRIGGVTKRYWERPLWPSPRGAWRAGVLGWSQRLLSLDLLPLSEGYVDLTTSPRGAWRHLAGWIKLWSDYLSQRQEAEPEAPPTAARKAQPGRPKLQMLADRALTDSAGDRLDFKAYADAIAGLIDNPQTGTPLTVAIHGPWGAGKSTLAQMIKRRLEGKPAAGGDHPHVTCWFNAWMHDDATDLAAAFAAEVARTADRLRPLWLRLVRPLPSALRPPGERIWRRFRLWGGALLTAALITALYVARRNHELSWAQDIVNNLLGLFGVANDKGKDLKEGTVFSLVTGFLLLIPHLTTVARSVSEFVRDPKAAASTGSMDRVRTQLGELIQGATPTGSRFVLFVDDLERCRPPRSVDVLEVVNQLLCHPDVVVVVMADMTAVAACAEIKYEKLATLYSPAGGPVQAAGSCTYGRSYLQKMIQLQFNLPPLKIEKIRGFIEDLAGIAAVQAPAGQAPPIVAPPHFQGRPTLRRALDTVWQSPYCGDLRAAAVNRRWWRAVLPVTRECLRLPSSGLCLWSSRVAYPPSSQLIQAEPSKAVRRLHLAREISAALYLPFAFAAALSLLATYFEPLLTRALGAPLPDLLWSGITLAVLCALGRVFLVRKQTHIEQAAPGKKPPAYLVPLRKGCAAGMALALTGAASASTHLAILRRPPVFSFESYVLLTIASLIIAAVFTGVREKAQHLADLAAINRARELTSSNIAEGVSEEKLAELLRAEAHLRTGGPELILEGVQLYLANESELLREAENEVMPFLPPLPRDAKRILNHLRLMLFIASARKVFGGQPEISARHFGKWVVLQERWPEVARLIIEAPSEIGHLETLAGSSPKFKHKIKELASLYQNDRDLQRFCASETKLAAIVERLLYFDPAS